MVDILHRVGINSKPEQVFAAIATIEGLADWWTTETKGNPSKGGTIDFGFCQMQVVASDPGKLVHWTCTGGPPEWVGTEVTFALQWKNEQTFVMFKHAGWKEPVEFMHHCSTKWAVFLMSLKNWIEREEGRPHPYDVKIHPHD